MAGEPVRGVGFVELVAAQLVVDFETYLGRAGQETRREIRKLYPDRVDEQAALAFIGSRDRDLLQGLPIDELHETPWRRSGTSSTRGQVLAFLRAADGHRAAAKHLIEESWQPLETLLEDSQSKTMLRAFGWYTIYRDCLDKA